MTLTMQRPTRRVRLFDAFLDEKARVERKLTEAGVDRRALERWAADKVRTGESLDYMETALTEAGVSASPLTEGGESELEVLLTEAGSTSDFGSYLADKVSKRFMVGYQAAPSTWREYSRTYSVPDFKPISFVGLSEMEDFLPVPEGGPVVDSQIDEIPGPTVQIEEFARRFTLTRKAMINDDLNQLRERPAGLGRAYARTLAKRIVGQLEANPNAYDGTPVFSVAHKNLIAAAPISIENVGKLRTGLRTQTNHNGERMTLQPVGLIVPGELEMAAEVILNSTVIPQPGTMIGGVNPVANKFKLVVEPYLTDPDDYYAYADPQEAPGLGVGFLNGKETPDIFIKDPGMRNVLGTSDPYDAVTEDIEWKGRGDFGTVIIDWRGLQKATN